MFDTSWQQPYNELLHEKYHIVKYNPHKNQRWGALRRSMSACSLSLLLTKFSQQVSKSFSITPRMPGHLRWHDAGAHDPGQGPKWYLCGVYILNWLLAMKNMLGGFQLWYYMIGHNMARDGLTSRNQKKLWGPFAAWLKQQKHNSVGFKRIVHYQLVGILCIHPDAMFQR